GLYYNRARYLDVRQARFWGMDTWEGDEGDPGSLHKYTYTLQNAANLVDPSGNNAAAESLTVAAGLTVLALTAVASINVLREFRFSLDTAATGFAGEMDENSFGAGRNILEAELALSLTVYVSVSTAIEKAKERLKTQVRRVRLRVKDLKNAKVVPVVKSIMPN